MSYDHDDMYGKQPALQPGGAWPQPRAFGDFTSHDYSFDYRAIWVHEDSGIIYAAYSSGCSCPTPFEEFRSLDDLSVVPDVVSFEGAS